MIGKSTLAYRDNIHVWYIRDIAVEMYEYVVFSQNIGHILFKLSGDVLYVGLYQVWSLGCAVIIFWF